MAEDIVYETGQPANPTKWQWGRIYELIIGNNTNNQGLLITDLAIKFRIKKSADNLRRSNNSCEIQIYNLSDESLKVLEQDYPLVALKVGYKAIGLKQLFVGNVTDIKTERQGPDRLTTLRASTAYTAINFKAINATIAAGNKVVDVIDLLRKGIDGVSKGVYAGTRINTYLPYGYTVSGSPQQVLKELCIAYNLEYRIDDTILYVNDIETVVSKNLDTIQLLSKDTGLLTSPYFSLGREGRAKRDARRAEGLKLKALLNADIVPGIAIKIEDGDIKEVRKVDNVEFIGESHGPAWDMNIELVTFNEAQVRATWRAKHKPKKVSKTSLPASAPLPPQ